MLIDIHPREGDRYRMPTRRVVVVTKVTAREVFCLYEETHEDVSFRRTFFEEVAWMVSTATRAHSH